MNRSINSGRDGCRYCVPDADGYSQCFRAVDGRQKSIFINPGGGTSPWNWTIEVSGRNYHHYAVEINFGPFCGRPLRDFGEALKSTENTIRLCAVSDGLE